MGYVLKAVLSSAQHPEYGQISVCVAKTGGEQAWWKSI